MIANKALHGGKNPASYTNINTSNLKVLAFSREKQQHKVTFIGNFSNENQTIENPSVGALDYDSKIKVNAETLKLDPWGFRILLQD